MSKTKRKVLAIIKECSDFALKILYKPLMYSVKHKTSTVHCFDIVIKNGTLEMISHSQKPYEEYQKEFQTNILIDDSKTISDFIKERKQRGKQNEANNDNDF